MSAVDISQLTEAICHRLGVDPSYVARLDLSPREARVVLWKGRDGRCAGPKYVDRETGEAPTEELVIPVSA